MDEQALERTRIALHGVAELLLAGPQHAAAGTIRLRIVPGGFAQVAGPLRVEGSELVWDGGRAALRGTARELGALAGVSAAAPAGVYADGSGLGPDDPLDVDVLAAARLTTWFGIGDAALRAFAPDTEPVLWPEHFDLGLTQAEVNYGVSPGDAAHPAPYAYVGPWTPRTGEFWNAPFGAVRAASELPDAAAVADFFRAGAAAAG